MGIRYATLVWLWCGLALPVAAESLRPDATGWMHDTQVRLALSGPVGHRVFTRAGPNRLFIDLDARIAPDFPLALLTRPGVATARAGVIADGWSRIVLALAVPMAVDTVALARTGQGAHLEITLRPTDQAAFDRTAQPESPVARAQEPLRIALDPGHGGVDPGAVRDGLKEKDLVLAFAKTLARAINSSPDMRAVMIRNEDIFVSLADRITLARTGGADILISIHANTVELGDAEGAAVFTLSTTASNGAAARLARLENRADLAAGLSFAAGDDAVTQMLVDIARVDTNARSHALATALVRSLADQVGVVRDVPLRSAFRVLSAPDMPSVLLELGFLSNSGDRTRMMTPEWRDRAAGAVLDAIRTWAAADRQK